MTLGIRSIVREALGFASAVHLLLACVLITAFATTAHSQSAVVAWDPNSEPDIAGYRIYRSELLGTYPPVSLNNGLTTSTSFTDYTPQNGRTYYYVITAMNSVGMESDYSDAITVTIPPKITNQPPAVSAGSSQTVILPASATLSVTASDDGLPYNTLTYRWTVLSGDGVVLSTPTQASTSASFTGVGTYTFRITVSDGALSSSADVTVYVKTGTNTGNRAPVLTSASPLTVTLPATASLTASATDDGLPNAVLTYRWSVISGTGVTIASPTSANTSASFLAAGTYVLRISVSDGELSSTADVTVYVNAATSGTLTNLTLVVSRNNEIIQGTNTPVLVESTDSRVQKLELYIDGQLKAVAFGSSLRYRWDSKKQSGAHTVEAKGFDATPKEISSAKATVQVR
jgi:hypothetical protein